MDINFEKLVPLLDKLNEKNDYAKINETPKVTQQNTYQEDFSKENNGNNENDNDTHSQSYQNNSNNPFENFGEIEKNIRKMKKIKKGMSGNPMEMLDMFSDSANPQMKNAMTIFKTMPAIMRALGNDEDEKDDEDNTFCEDDQVSSDIPNNKNINNKNVKTQDTKQENATYTGQNIHFDFRRKKPQNHNEYANQNINKMNNNENENGIFKNFIKK